MVRQLLAQGLLAVEGDVRHAGADRGQRRPCCARSARSGCAASRSARPGPGAAVPARSQKRRGRPAAGGRTAVRAAAGLAGRHGQGAGRAGLRDLPRRDPARRSRTESPPTWTPLGRISGVGENKLAKLRRAAAGGAAELRPGRSNPGSDLVRVLHHRRGQVVRQPGQAVVLGGVLRDGAQDALLVGGVEDPLAAGHHVTAGELLHRSTPLSFADGNSCAGSGPLQFGEADQQPFDPDDAHRPAALVHAGDRVEPAVHRPGDQPLGQLDHALARGHLHAHRHHPVAGRTGAGAAERGAWHQQRLRAAPGVQQQAEGAGRDGAAAFHRHPLDQGPDGVGQFGLAAGGPQPGGRGRGQAGPRLARPAEQEALGQWHPEPGERLQLRPGLHALGQQPGVDPAGELAEQTGQGQLDLVVVGVGDQGAVELDQVRPHPGDLLQPGVARARVVQGQQPAALGQLVAQPDQRHQVGDLLVLGQLQDQRGQVAGGQQRTADPRVGEQVRADVDGQEGVRRQGVLQCQAAPDDDRLEVGAAADRVGGGEPAVRPDLRPALLTGPQPREAGQRLVPDDRALGDADDRLEDQGQPARVLQHRPDQPGPVEQGPGRERLGPERGVLDRGRHDGHTPSRPDSVLSATNGR